MIVNTLKICTGDAGPEQSLVLFFIKVRLKDRSTGPTALGNDGPYFEIMGQ